MALTQPYTKRAGAGSAEVMSQPATPDIDASKLWLHPSKTVNTFTNIPTFHEVQSGVWVEMLWKVDGVWQNTAPTSLIAQDNFNRSGVLVPSTTSDGKFTWADLWAGSGSNLKTNGSALLNNTSYHAAALDLGVANVDMSVGVTSIVGNGGGWVGFTFRGVDLNNYWETGWNPGTTAGTYNYTIWKNIAGVFTEVARLDASAAVPSSLRLVCNGSSIELFVNGTSTLTTTDTAHNTATRHGFSVAGSATDYTQLDNFEVATLS